MAIEEDTRIFLKRVTNTISSVLVFLILHVMVGLYLGWALFAASPTWQNWVYYAVFAATAVLLVYVLRRIWKN